MDSATVPTEGFTKLKQLNMRILSNNGLRGALPVSIAELTSLRFFTSMRNQLNDSIPWSFQKLDMLSKLRLNDNELIVPLPFSREMLWKMGEKLVGLCYDMSNGRHKGIDSISGVNYCSQRSKTKKAEGRNAAGVDVTRHLMQYLRRT